jgi:hypothetical protein
MEGYESSVIPFNYAAMRFLTTDAFAVEVFS